MAYEVTILESSKELTNREKIRMKDTTDSVPLDGATQTGEPLIFSPESWAILGIHNDKGEDKDYKNYLVIDSNGVKYRTGSESFWNAFTNIWNELKDETEEWEIKVYRLPSKNRSGKDFITCSLV